MVGEAMPDENNRVTLDPAEGRVRPSDRPHPLRVDRQRQETDRPRADQMEMSLRAAGAKNTFRQEQDASHLGGTARMGADPRVERCRTPIAARGTSGNLWVCDGSVFPRSAASIPRSPSRPSRCARRTASRLWRGAANCDQRPRACAQKPRPRRRRTRRRRPRRPRGQDCRKRRAPSLGLADETSGNAMQVLHRRLQIVAAVRRHLLFRHLSADRGAREIMVEQRGGDAVAEDGEEGRNA